MGAGICATGAGEDAELGIGGVGQCTGGSALPGKPHAGEVPAGVWEDEEPRVLLWVLRIQAPALPAAPRRCRMSWAAAGEGSKPRGNPPPPGCRGEGGDSRLQSPPHPPVLRNGPTGILPGSAGLAGSGSAAPGSAAVPSPAQQRGWASSLGTTVPPQASVPPPCPVPRAQQSWECSQPARRAESTPLHLEIKREL